MTVLLPLRRSEGKRGIVRNWVTLERWKRLYGFPSGRLIAPNTRVWSEDDEIDAMARVPPDRG